MSRSVTTLVTANLPSNALAFTNCVFVNPIDLEKVALSTGEDPARAAKGLLCAVGEGVFIVK
jgi:hypothetical protein